MVKLDASKNPPRAITDFRGKVNFSKGLEGYYFYYYFLVIFGPLLLISIFVPPCEAGLIIFKASGAIIFGGLGLKLLLGTYKKIKVRLLAFEKGVFVGADVVRHGKIFVSWKSARDFFCSYGV